MLAYGFARTLTAVVASLLVACPSALAKPPAAPPPPAGPAKVAGPIPKGLPPQLLVGLFEEAGKTWMRDSGVPWGARYRYFTKGWVDNYGHGARDGAFARTFFEECAKQGSVPVVVYYQVNDEPGGGEPAFHVKARNAATMRGYFGDFKILLQRARQFGRPVVIVVEPDGFALMQQQSRSNPNAPAAVTSTGLPELAGLPDTVAGWGLAFLQLRKAVGANSAILALPVSAWASGKDLAYFSVRDPLEPEVKKVHAFLSPLGLGPNATGQTWDVLVGDPLDRDADYYRLERKQDRWWDARDGAPVSSRSFNRYAEWMRLWNVAAGRRWILWQIPVGNSNHLNVENAGAPRQGYKDNRAEYFFGPNGRAHLEKFTAAGAIALLFGFGPKQATHENDYYTDGQLFLKSRVGAFLASGGLALPPGPVAVPEQVRAPSADLEQAPRPPSPPRRR